MESFIVEKPYWNGWFGGTTIFGNIHISFCPAKVFTHTICLRDRPLDHHLCDLWGVRKLAAPWRRFDRLSMTPFWGDKGSNEIKPVAQDAPNVRKTSHLGRCFRNFFNSNVLLKFLKSPTKNGGRSNNEQTNHTPTRPPIGVSFCANVATKTGTSPSVSLTPSVGGGNPKVGSKKSRRHGVWRHTMGTVCCSREVESSSSLFGEHAPLPKLPKKHGPAGPGGTSLEVEKGRHLLEQIGETPWRETWEFLCFEGIFFPTFRKNIYVWKYESGSQDGELVFPSGPGGAKVLVLVISVIIILSLVWFSSRNMI